MISMYPPILALSVDIPVATNYSTVNTNHSLTSDYATNSGQLEGRDTATLKTYLQGLYDSIYCKLTGCTMAGDINMGDNNITNAGYIETNNINITQGDYPIYSAIFDWTGLGVLDVIELVGDIGTVYFRNGITIRGEDNFARITFGDSLDAIDKMGTATTTYYPSALGDYPSDSLVFTDATGGYYFDGNITATNFIGDGSNLYNVNIDASGNVSIGGNLNVSGNSYLNNIYAGMYYHNHTGTELNFATDGHFYHLFMTNVTYNNGFTFDVGFETNSTITTGTGGLYQATYMSSGDGQNNHEYFTSVFINEENQDNCESHHKMAAGGDIITQSGNCFINLNSGDNVSLRTADIGGTGIGNYYSSNINLVRMGN